MTKTIFVLNGPNLNLFGQRQPEVYGFTTLADIEAGCVSRGAELGLKVDFRQSNSEGTLVDWIQEARAQADGIVINPAAYSHTSIALLDALHAFDGPVIEVHVSQVHKREAFRHHSYVSARADGIIVGLGPFGYDLAMQAVAELLDPEPRE